MSRAPVLHAEWTKLRTAGGEYGTGMIRRTLAAMPRRVSVLAAKAAVVTGLVLAAGAVAAVGSVLAGQLILPGHGLAGPPLSLGNGADLRAALGSALYLALIGLLALGVTTAVRDSAAAIGIVLGLLFLFPLLAATAGAGAWRRHLEQIAPMTAGLDIQATANIRALPLTPGKASACSPPGPPERSSSAAWRCDSATPRSGGVPDSLWVMSDDGRAAAPATVLVNGQRREARTEQDTALLYVLRNHLGLKGTRFGCGIGLCGACMVLIDGRATYSCDTPLWAVADKEITTVEGLGPADRPHPVTEALIAGQAAQCGYCLSGVTIAAVELLRHNDDPSDAEVRAALDRNLCRCGAHNRITGAILAAAAELRSGRGETA